MLQPKFWRPLMKLGRNSSFAARALAAKVQKFLLEKNIDRANKTGAV
jgi:adenosylhomocysteine nucleosidase